MNPIADPPGGAPQHLPTAKLSALAVLSLLFGLIGCTGVGALAGIACGVIALVRINNSAGRLTGKGLAIAGMAVSLAMMVFAIPVLAGMLLPALAKAKQKALIVSSVNNVKQLGLAARLYADSSGDKFPAASNWNDSLRTYLGSDPERKLKRPAAQDQNRGGYGYNLQVAGLPTSQVDPDVVLFFELETPMNDAVGGEELLRQPQGRSDRVIVGFADGSAHQITADELANLRWKP